MSLLLGSKVAYEYSQDASLKRLEQIQVNRSTNRLVLEEKIRQAEIAISDRQAWQFTMENNTGHPCFLQACNPPTNPWPLKLYDFSSTLIVDNNNTDGVSSENKSCSTWTETGNTTSCVYKVKAEVLSYCLDVVPCENHKHVIRLWVESSDNHSPIDLTELTKSVSR